MLSHKISRFITALLLVSLVVSCKKDKIDNDSFPEELKNLKLITTISDNEYNIELYNRDGKLETGLNEIYLQIRNKRSNILAVYANVEVSTSKIINGKTIGSPVSSFIRRPDIVTVNQGLIIFQESGIWGIEIKYTADGISHQALSQVVVDESPLRHVNSITTADSTTFVAALVSPIKEVKEGINDITVALYKTDQTQTNFIVANQYKILVNPRITSELYSSTGNVNLSQNSNGLYTGKLNLDKKGFWDINLQLTDNSNHVIAGNETDSTQLRSSWYFEISL